MNPDSAVEIETNGRARCKPYAAKTMGLGPLAATVLRCVESYLETKGSGGLSAKENLKTIGFCVFVAAGLHRALCAISDRGIRDA
jgi:hypothetical protein